MEGKNLKRILIAMLALMPLWANSQPKFAAKVKKSIVSMNTYDKHGDLLHQGIAFYVGPNGEAVADYKVMKGAYKAVVIDASGRQADVDCVLGADDTYSLVRFRVNTKGNAVLPSASSVLPMKSSVFVLKAADGDVKAYEEATVVDTSFIQGKYAYYGLDKKVDDGLLGAPVFDTSGTLVGIMHSSIGEKSYVLDIRFREVLQMVAIPSASASVALSNIFLPKGLPDTAEEALVYLYFKTRSTSNEEYLDMTNRFVASFPQNAEGYLRRATSLIDMVRFDEADADLQKYLSLVADKAVGNFNVASTINDKLNLQPEPAYEKWNWDVVLQYVNQAIVLNEAKPAGEERAANDSKFKILKAQVLQSKKDYDAALTIYEALNEGEGRAPSYYYAISLAREGRGDSISALIEPIDSAIAMMGTPLPGEAANYVIRRGQLYANGGRYRDAVQDYNQYCYLMNNKVSAAFYYERSQIEVNARMFQQALDDINRTIGMAPRVPAYYVEKAALAIRLNLLDDCIQACQTVIQLNPAIIDSYRILGYAQLQKGDKVNARLNLQKAVDMGDEGAQKILETYF